MKHIQGMSHSQSDKCVLTLGKFNGIHRGHQKLIRRVLEISQNKNIPSVVVAFVTGDKCLLTSEERANMLDDIGVDYFVECPLDRRFMSQGPMEFIENILVKHLHGIHVVVGPDFRFGYQRKGDVNLLTEIGKKAGYEVEILHKERQGSREISSTYIREQLNEGNMELVNCLLGYEFSTTGEVLHGRGLGHKIGIPTTNLIPPANKLMPPNGVYVTRSYFSGGVYDGITNVGYKPTVGGEEFLGVETYLFDCEENLYGEKSKVEFYHYLRPERHFPSLEELVVQLDKDKKAGRDFLVKKSMDK